MMKLSTLKFLHICPLLVLFYPIVVTTMSQSKNTNYTFPAVIVFGDSILDTGNNDYIKTIVKANFKPYGRDFIGGIPTGRFSNGKLPSYFFAILLGLKEALPPYLDPNLKNEDLLTGVCSASAGSGSDPLTVTLASVLSIEDQLNLFSEYIGKLEASVGEERTGFILAQSIYVISLGSNDIALTYSLTPFRKKQFDIEEYTSMLVNMSSNFLQELYQLGARRIAVPSLPPLGCVPLQRTVGGGIERNCVESVNQAALLFNSKLSSSITTLGEVLPDSKLVYLDIYIEPSEIIQQHIKFGFEVEDSACCGIANVEFGFLCNSLTLKICEDASKYVLWDATERTYYKIVSEIIEKYMDKFV